MSLCPDCHDATMRWLDYDRTPVRGWRNYPPNPKRDLETRRSYIEDRVKLIRQQTELIQKICATKHNGGEPTA